MKNTLWNHLANIEVQVRTSTPRHLNSSALFEDPSLSYGWLKADSPLHAPQLPCRYRLPGMSLRLYILLVALSTIHQHDRSS